MPHLTDTIEINASPEAVWSVLGNLSATPDWLPGTVSAQVDNGTRICTMADGSQVHEQIDRATRCPPEPRAHWGACARLCRASTVFVARLFGVCHGTTKRPGQIWVRPWSHRRRYLVSLVVTAGR